MDWLPEIKADRERRALYRRRAVRMFLVTLFISGTFAAVLGRGGYLDFRRASTRVRLQQAQIQVERSELGRARATIESLKKEPMARERIAREQLGMAAPGEILFLLPRGQDHARGQDQSKN